MRSGPDDRGAERLPGAERGELASRAVSGVRWAAGGQGVGELVAFLATIALARLISPTEYGYAAAAIIFPTLAEVLLYEGFGTNLVRDKEATRREAGVALSLSLLAGTKWFDVVFLGALLLEPTLGSRQVLLFQLSAFAFLLSAPNVVPQALLQRQLAFRTIAARDGLSLLVGAAAAVAMAAAGAGATAVIGGLLVRRLTTTALLAIVTERIGPRWDREVARRVIGFGALSSLAGALTLTRRNVDYFMLSFLLPARQVGLYYRAYSVGVDYQGKLTTFANRLMLPLYARSSDPADMWSMRRRFARLQTALVVPVLAVFLVCAPQLVPVLFGDRWSESVLPAQILTVVPLVALLGNGTAPLLIASGRPGVVATTNGINLALYVVAILAFAQRGLVTLCIAVAVFNLVFALVATYVLINRVLGFEVREVLIEFVAPLVAVAPAVAIALPVVGSLDPSVAAAALSVPAVALLCTASFVLVYRLAFPRTWRDVEDLVRRVLKRERLPAPA